MLVALHDDQLVTRQVLARDIPRGRLAALAAAKADALALPYRVEHQPDVLADDGALGRAHHPRPACQIAIQKLAKRSLTDEANPRRITLRVHREARLPGETTHFGLREVSERKQGSRELRLIQTVQEIGLILGAVASAQQLESAFVLAHPGVVAGGDAARPHLHRA